MHPAPTYIVASLLGTLIASSVSANPRADVRVIVLRSTADTSDIQTRIDRALLASLSTEAGFGQAEISPVPLSDLGLAAGCNDRSRTCLTRIAGTVDADVVILRDLESADERPVLALTSFDALGVGAPIYVERPIEQNPDEEVATMVRELYAEPVPVSPSRDQVSITPRTIARRSELRESDESGSSISPVTVVTLGAGAVALGAGVVVGMAADRSHDAYGRTRVRSDADADRALGHLDAAEDRALAANVLYGAGGALLAVGATLLFVDLLGDDGDEGVSLSVSATPVAAGIVLGGTTGAW